MQSIRSGFKWIPAKKVSGFMRPKLIEGKLGPVLYFLGKAFWGSYWSAPFCLRIPVLKPIPHKPYLSEVPKLPSLYWTRTQNGGGRERGSCRQLIRWNHSVGVSPRRETWATGGGHRGWTCPVGVGSAPPWCRHSRGVVDTGCFQGRDFILFHWGDLEH